MEGENLVILKGTIKWPELKTVGEHNTSLFKGKLVVPVAGQADRAQWIKIAAWRDVAEGLGSLPEGTPIKAHGHIEERSYDGKCKHCNGYDKKYWTEVVVDNFVIEEK
jgi:single-stranded DNA-binding protein